MITLTMATIPNGIVLQLQIVNEVHLGKKFFTTTTEETVGDFCLAFASGPLELQAELLVMPKIGPLGSLSS